MIDEIVDISYKNILSFLCNEITPLAFFLLISLGCITSFYDFQGSGNTIFFILYMISKFSNFSYTKIFCLQYIDSWRNSCPCL